MKNTSVSSLFAFMLIGVGSLWLIGNFFPGLIMWSILWPIFILFPGLLLLFAWRGQANAKVGWRVLIPAVILISLAILFFFNSFITTIFNYPNIWGWTAFGYTGSVAVALWITGLTVGKKGLLDAAKVLGIITLFILMAVWVSMAFTLLPGGLAGKLWPIILIFIGLFALFQQMVWKLWKRNDRYFGKTEEEWKEWGENLGNDIEKTIKGE